MSNAIWQAQERQRVFLSRGEDEVLFGGSAGGGKSDALVAEALRQVQIPHYKGIIFRKTYKQLEEIIGKTQRIYKGAFPKARYNSSSHTWTFPSGAKVLLRNMEHEDTKYDYQGHQYQYIAFDELTHFSYSQYEYLKSRNRPDGPGVKCYIRASANPGGIGHAWVKERFITAAVPMTTIWDDVNWMEPDGSMKTSKMSRVFVPSSVWDNQKLLENDPTYIARLASLPEAEKNALLYGNWDTFSGQVFTEWVNDPKHYQDRKHTHVIDPFPIPRHWPIWVGLDWGYSRPYSVHWYAIGDDRTMYCIRELYGCTGTPNQGVQQEPTEVARQIKEIEATDPNIRGHQINRVGDPAIWTSQGTESIGALMERERVYFEKADNDRINGKMQCHHRLAFDQYDQPMFYVFHTCKHFIRTVPNLVYSETNVEDVDTTGEDHAYDEWRYVSMRNPIAAPIKEEPKPKPYDPLDPMDNYYRTTDDDRYAFYRKY